MLNTAKTLKDYALDSLDGEIGKVKEFYFDNLHWTIRYRVANTGNWLTDRHVLISPYLIVDTRNWWPGKKVLVSPQWIKSVSWGELKVFVNLTREAIQQAPEYTEESLLTRDYEAALHRHYDRPGYWADEPSAKKPSD